MPVDMGQPLAIAANFEEFLITAMHETNLEITTSYLLSIEFETQTQFAMH
jgi:hypothetical protein